MSAINNILASIPAIVWLMVSIAILLTFFLARLISLEIRLITPLIKAMGNVRMEADAVLQRSADNLDKIDRSFKASGSSVLASAWENYRVLIKEHEADEAWLNPRVSFRYDNIIGNPCRRSETEAVPGTLMGLGVLFTLLDMAMVVAFGAAEAASVLDSLWQNAAPLFFIPAIAVLLSILYQGIERKNTAKAEWECEVLLSVLEKKLPVVAAEQGLVATYGRQPKDRSANDSLTGSVRSMENLMKGYMDRMETMEGRILEKVSKNYMEMLNHSTEGRLQSINSGLEQMASTMENMTTGIQEAFSLGKQQTNQQQELASKTSLLMEQLNASQNNLMDVTTSLRQVMDGVEGYVQLMASLMEANQQNANNLSVTYEQFDNQTREMGLYVNEINRSIDGLNLTLQGNVKAFSDQVKDCINISYEGFDKGMAEAVGRLGVTLDELRVILEELPKRIKAVEQVDGE